MHAKSVAVECARARRAISSPACRFSAEPCRTATSACPVCLQSPGLWTPPPAALRADRVPRPPTCGFHREGAPPPRIPDRLRPRASAFPDPRYRHADYGDRKSVVSGKSVSVRVDLGGRRIIKKKKVQESNNYTIISNRSDKKEYVCAHI